MHGVMSRHDVPGADHSPVLHGEAHKRKAADGRLQEYIRMNDENVEAQYVRTASVATREALRKAMANAPQL